MYRFGRILFVICFFISLVLSLNEFPENSTELLYTLVVFRHGDRTPEPLTSLELSEDPDRDTKLSHPFGLAGLTNAGKERGFKIGQYIRERYHSLLSDIYLSDEIFMRSTDLERTKMTMLTCAAGLYPPVDIQRWNASLLWQPIPYTTVAFTDDFLAFFFNCKSLDFFKSLNRSEPGMDQHLEILRHLTSHTRFNFVDKPLHVLKYNDLITSQKSIKVPPPKWLKGYGSKLRMAANSAINFMYKTKSSIRLGGGVLLNKFLEATEKIIAGENVKQRVRLYSAHELNVAVQMAAARVSFGVPKYGAVFSLELRRIKKTGRYIVTPVYLEQAGASKNPIHMHIKGCEGDFCDYQNFKQLTASFSLSEDEFREECKK